MSAIIACIFPWFITTPNLYQQALVSVNNYQLTAAVATTPVQQDRGLAIADRINENEGMLFFLGENTPAPFWMKEMKFPIDIIWLDQNKRVIFIKQNLQPCPSVNACPTYAPNQNAEYVLETMAGFSQQHHIIPQQTVVNWKLLCKVTTKPFANPRS